MVFTEHTGLQNLYTMLRYCLNGSECRRALIARSFGERWRASDCLEACDVCKSSGRVRRTLLKMGCYYSTTMCYYWDMSVK